jgi:FtsZ-interacting cell division protein ZipA
MSRKDIEPELLNIPDLNKSSLASETYEEENQNKKISIWEKHMWTIIICIVICLLLFLIYWMYKRKTDVVETEPVTKKKKVRFEEKKTENSNDSENSKEPENSETKSEGETKSEVETKPEDVKKSSSDVVESTEQSTLKTEQVEINDESHIVKSVIDELMGKQIGPSNATPIENTESLTSEQIKIVASNVASKIQT